jgi:hypothetical protein
MADDWSDWTDKQLEYRLFHSQPGSENHEKAKYLLEKRRREKADSNSSITIGSIQNFAGNIGQVGGVSSIQATQESSYAIDLDAVGRLAIQMNKYADELPSEARSPIEELNKELKSASPNQSRVRAVLGSVKSVLEGAAGNVIASGILVELAKILTH